jgi:HEPN domain-containing protein
LGEALGRLKEFKDFEEENSLEFASLEDVYVTSRYFPRKFEKSEVERLKKFVEMVEEIVRKFVG